MKAYRFLLFLLLPGLLLSCEKQADWPLQEGATSLLIVDGIITNEMKQQQVLLTRPTAGPNDQPTGVSGADVIVTVGDSIYHFHEDTLRRGTYVSDRAFSGVIDEDHSLLITLGSAVFSAKAKMDPTTSNLSLPGYTYNSSNGLYSVNSVADQYDPAFPSMYELSLDWSELPGYVQKEYDSTHARLVYYVLPTLDVSEILPPTVESVYFPAGTKVIARKYSLTREHAEFARALLSETKWQGGLFSSAVANVPTNLSAGAGGYFAACVVVSKEAVISKK